MRVCAAMHENHFLIGLSAHQMTRRNTFWKDNFFSVYYAVGASKITRAEKKHCAKNSRRAKKSGRHLWNGAPLNFFSSFNTNIWGANCQTVSKPIFLATQAPFKKFQGCLEVRREKKYVISSHFVKKKEGGRESSSRGNRHREKELFSMLHLHSQLS